MSLGRRAVWFPLALLLSAMPALAQPTPDCGKARTAAEKAICGDPALSAADMAMAKGYAALVKTLAPAQQAGLRRDQRQWVKDRDGGCAEQKEAALTQCLLAATDMRRRFLAGEGNNGPAGAPPLLPMFYYEAKKGAYEVTITTAKFRPWMMPPTTASHSEKPQPMSIRPPHPCSDGLFSRRVGASGRRVEPLRGGAREYARHP